MSTAPEPWLRGALPTADPLTAPIVFALQQAREDLTRYLAPLSIHQIWATPHSLGSVGFHVRHIAQSTDRLLTYAEGRQLSADQMSALKDEEIPGAGSEDLLAEINSSFDRVEAFIRTLDRTRLIDPREVGRKRLPTTVIGLLIHIAEHTQRHVGQAISAAKLVCAL
jgi:uncharacterized damage-inducible protein DinB